MKERVEIERHHLKDCTEPRNEPKIAEALKKFQAARRSRGKPKHKTSADSKPLILNELGFYALDSRKWQALLAAARPASTPAVTSPQANVAIPTTTPPLTTLVLLVGRRTTTARVVPSVRCMENPPMAFLILN